MHKRRQGAMTMAQAVEYARQRGWLTESSASTTVASAAGSSVFTAGNAGRTNAPVTSPITHKNSTGDHDIAQTIAANAIRVALANVAKNSTIAPADLDTAVAAHALETVCSAQGAVAEPATVANIHVPVSLADSAETTHRTSTAVTDPGLHEADGCSSATADSALTSADVIANAAVESTTLEPSSVSCVEDGRSAVGIHSWGTWIWSLIGCLPTESIPAEPVHAATVV